MSRIQVMRNMGGKKTFMKINREIGELKRGLRPECAENAAGQDAQNFVS